MPKAALTGEVVASDSALEAVTTLVKGKSDPHLPAGAKRTSTGSVHRNGRFISTYKPLIGAAIVEGIEKGMPVTFAASRVRVPQSTCSTWIAKGEQDIEEGIASDLADFVIDVRQAQAAFVEKAMDGIVDAGLSDAKQWTALMTALERLHPEHFKRPDQKNTTNINVAVGFVERKLHELHAAGEIVYDGG